MRILVTGGAGFIGSHIVEALAARGHEVTAFDILHPAAHRVRPSYLDGVPIVLGDVRDARAVHDGLSGVDAVVHQAAMVGLGVDVTDMPEYAGSNDLGTAVLLAEMARSGVGRLVLASSMVIYGEGRYRCPVHATVRPGTRRLPDLDSGNFDNRCPRCDAPLLAEPVPEDTPADPRNVYAATKLAQEHFAAAWARATGGVAVALRYHNVYGPRMPRDTPYSGVAAIFRSALEAGQPPRVYEDGRQRRDFVHVRDVAAANLLALAATGESDLSGRLSAYNVASGEPHTVGEMADALSDAFGGPAPVVTGQYRHGDVRHIVADPSRAHAELGFTARVSFVDGMKEFATAPLRS